MLEITNPFFFFQKNICHYDTMITHLHKSDAHTIYEKKREDEAKKTIHIQKYIRQRLFSIKLSKTRKKLLY